MITIPTSISMWTSQGMERKYPLNYNRFRTLNRFLESKIKKEFTETILPLIQHLPEYDKPITITYTLYLNSRRKSDLMNWISIIDKFFQDVLVAGGKIKDDNYDYVPEIVARWGGVEPNRARVEVEIHPFIEEY